MTSFQVPSYNPPGKGWQLVDYKPGLVLTATAGADGTATATAATVDPGFMWSVQRAVVSSTSVAQTSVRLYDSVVGAGNLLSGSNSGNYDEADYPAGLLVDQSRQLVAVWSGCDNNAKCTLRLQVAVLQLIGG